MVIDVSYFSIFFSPAFSDSSSLFISYRFTIGQQFFFLLSDFASLEINILLLGDIFLLLFYRRKEKK